MLEKFLKKSIDFKRVTETLDTGIKLAQQAMEGQKESDVDLVKQTKEKVNKIISEYNPIYTGALIWANNQRKVMDELKQTISKVEAQSEPELSNSI